ncbi:MAG: hypothetical protein IT432_07165 [Phycisphaerales bacterium]|nr:hypothetical protein [Phycisphaerales bacterium]
MTSRKRIVGITIGLIAIAVFVVVYQRGMWRIDADKSAHAKLVSSARQAMMRSPMGDLAEALQAGLRRCEAVSAVDGLVPDRAKVDAVRRLTEEFLRARFQSSPGEYVAWRQGQGDQPAVTMSQLRAWFEDHDPALTLLEDPPRDDQSLDDYFARLAPVIERASDGRGTLRRLAASAGYWTIVFTIPAREARGSSRMDAASPRTALQTSAAIFGMKPFWIGKEAISNSQESLFATVCFIAEFGDRVLRPVAINWWWSEKEGRWMLTGFDVGQRSSDETTLIPY